MAGVRWKAAGIGLLGVSAVAAWEAAAVARAVRRGDEGGRADHARHVGEGLGEPLRLVLLGDSAVDGYGLTADEALPRQLAARIAKATGRRVQVRSLAVSGATTADVAAFQVPLLRAAGGVDVVFVGTGVNDALKRIHAAAVTEATRQLVVGLRDAAPTAVTAVLPCYDLSSAPGFGPVLRRLVGARCRAVARRQVAVLEEHGVPWVDLRRPDAPAMTREQVRALYGRDGLHPGAGAVELVADAAVDVLVAPTVDA